MNNLEALKVAKDNHKTAGEALADATAAAFPVGSEITVTLGKSTVHGRVTGSGSCWWYQPDSVSIENLKTGKLRTFQAANSDAAIQKPA